jgi:tetracycline 7-halogenase / FADH2 O2-dependent halogenase
MTPARTQATDYDVAILGSHFAPAILAAILARQGARVLLADAEGDRTEPSGETTVPYTSEVFRLLADRFGVPEIGAFAHFTDLPDEIRAASGTKGNISFLYHQPGVPQDPRQVVQFNVPGEHTEWHVNRPAAEEYLRRVAVRYGARRVAGDPVVTGVGLAPDGAVITLSSGDDFRCRYVVDASGPGSVLLASQGVAIRSDALRLRSRVLATRMTRVRPLEQCLQPADYPRATPWSAGTVSHLFPGGWIQVVPFGNHSEARSTLCGVTAAVDPDRFADLPADPQQAFALLTERFPTIAAQFTGSEPVQPWQDAQPWQRSATITSGAQWFAVERSAARTEELLSRDVTMATEVVHALAAAMLRILKDGSPAAAEFERVARFQDALIDFNDRMLAAARTACRDFALWNAFSRVWLLWQILADLSLKRARMDSGPTWEPVDDLGAGALWFRTPAGLSGLLSQFFREMERVDSGAVSPGTAAQRIFRMLAMAPFVPPLYRFADPRAWYYRFTSWRRLMMLLWVKTTAPRDFRRLLTRDNVTARRLPPPVRADEPCRMNSTSVDFNS